MFGFNRSRRRARSGGVLSSTNLRKAALAGVGLLAVQWWRKRQASGSVTWCPNLRELLGFRTIASERVFKVAAPMECWSGL